MGVCAQVLNRNSVKPTHLGGGGGSAGKVPICVEIRLLRVMEIREWPSVGSLSLGLSTFGTEEFQREKNK